jgi:hypothetical protein
VSVLRSCTRRQPAACLYVPSFVRVALDEAHADVFAHKSTFFAVTGALELTIFSALELDRASLALVVATLENTRSHSDPLTPEGARCFFDLFRARPLSVAVSRAGGCVAQPIDRDRCHDSRGRHAGRVRLPCARRRRR